MQSRRSTHQLVGNYKNGGTDYRPKGDPRRVKVHDFEDKELGKVVPYGVYDISANAGWVSVGINGDTAQFAVASIRRWLDVMGRERYPDARELTITADGGGSNGSRVRLWKVELYSVHVTTRKSLGLTIRKLSVTESQMSAQFRGTFSRRKPSVASANWAQVG